MFLRPLPTRSRTESRSTILPSPRVIRPLRSTTVTPSTCLLFAFKVTSSLLGICGLAAYMFYQCNLGPWIQISDVHFIHKRTDEKDATSRCPHQILRGQRIRNALR